MSENEKTVIIDQFNLQMFKTYVEQNLMTDNQIIIRFDPDMVKSAAMTRSQSYIKMWQAPLANFQFENNQENSEIIDLDDPEFDKITDKICFKPFNVFVLKGDIFKRYLSVFSQEPVTLEFSINVKNDKDTDQAAKLKISGKSILGSKLETVFTLTSEDMIVTKIEDYDQLTAKMTPAKDACAFILSIDDIQEIKRLVKDLHKTNPQNSSFLEFKINSEKGIVTVSDRVFDISFLLNNFDTLNPLKEDLEFRILKSDFIVTGNHSYTFYYSKDFIIINSNYKKCIISGLIGTTKSDISENDQFANSFVSDDISDNLDSSDLEAYFN
jgi:hypothetical protein